MSYEVLKEQRTIIKFLVEFGKLGNEILSNLENVFKNEAMKKHQVMCMD